MNRVSLSLLLAVLIVGTALVGPAAAAKKIPVILDTDIGGDIDDTWALVMLLNSPEFDIKLITTATGDTTCRAKIAAKLLEVAKRTDIPIGIGIRGRDKDIRQAPWVEDYFLSNYPGKVYQDGVDVMIKTIMRSKEPITIIAIGPVTNVAAALEREPRIAERARYVGMQGAVRRGYGGGEPESEYNVGEDPEACQKVFTALWDMTITPLDTCGIVRLDADRYAKVHQCPDPLVRSLVANWWIWTRDRHLPPQSSTLYDTVAIYLGYTDELLKMERVGIRVTDDGMTVEDKEAKVINCALEWKDKPAFLDLIVERVTSGAYIRSR